MIVPNAWMMMNVMMTTGRVVSWVVVVWVVILEGSDVTGKPILTIMTIPSPFRTRGTTLPSALRGKFP